MKMQTGGENPEQICYVSVGFLAKEAKYTRASLLA